VVNEASSTVSVYDFDRENGIIDLVQTVSTLPEKSGGKSWAAEVKISPDGKRLYASNRGHDSIVYFDVGEKTGRLSLMGCVPASQKPRSFDISKDGRFLYAAGEASGELVSYKLDEKTGKPEEIARELAGNCPMWVMAVSTR
jgi:6-phosphogluconolactonase